MASRRALLGLVMLVPGAAAQSPLGGSAPLPPLPPLPPVALATGVAVAGPGTWRVDFALDSGTPDAGQAAAIGRLGAALAAGSVGRVTLIALASAGDEISTHRRLALTRALGVKAALVAGGLPETRIDLRALGRTEAARDSVDILAPTAPRP